MVALVHSLEQQGHGQEREKGREDRLVLERRIFGRRRVNVEADARRLDHTVAARREPRVKLVVRDLSIGGLSAVSAIRVECGEYLGVYFPPELGQRSWSAFGRVIRSEPGEQGYELAVEFESLPAA